MVCHDTHLQSLHLTPGDIISSFARCAVLPVLLLKRVNAVHSLLCRAWYFSSSQEVRRSVFWEDLVILAHRASFPYSFGKRHALAWAQKWIPNNRVSPCLVLKSDIGIALLRLESSSK